MKGRFNRMISAAVLIAAMMLLLPVNADAAPELKPDGTWFDPVYYAAANPDVLLAFGLNPDAMYEHYQTYGRAEGRLPYEGAQAMDPAALQALLNAGASPAQTADPAVLLAALSAAGINPAQMDPAALQAFLNTAGVSPAQTQTPNLAALLATQSAAGITPAQTDISALLAAQAAAGNNLTAQADMAYLIALQNAGLGGTSQQDVAALLAAQASLGNTAAGASESVPASEFGNYHFNFINGAPLTKSAYMAELINRARIDHKTDTYIHGYPFFWDKDLANAAQLKAEQYVYSRTYEKPVTTAWYSVLPQKYQVQNLVEIDVNGGGNPEEIVGYWTAYQDAHIEKKKIEYEDDWGEKQTREETVMVEGRYIHPSADMNKIFNHESRYIGVGHVASDKYNMRDYWVVLLGK